MSKRTYNAPDLKNDDPRQNPLGHGERVMNPELFSEDLQTALCSYQKHRSLFERVSGLMNEYAAALMLYSPGAYSNWLNIGENPSDSLCTDAGEDFVLAYVSLDEIAGRAQGELVKMLLDLFGKDAAYQAEVLGKAAHIPEEAREENLHLALATMPPEIPDELDNGAMLKHLEDFFAGKITVPPCMTDNEVDCHCGKCKNTFYIPGNPPDEEPPYYDAAVVGDLYALISHHVYFAACARSCRRRLRGVYDELCDNAYAVYDLFELRDGEEVRVRELYEQGITAIEDARSRLSAVADDTLDELCDLVKVLLRSDEAKDVILQESYEIPCKTLDQAAARISLFFDVKDPPSLEDIMPAFLENAKWELAGMIRDDK